MRQWGRKPLLPYPQQNEKRRGSRGAGAAFCLVPLFWPRKTKGLALADDTRDLKLSLAIASSIYMIFTRCIRKQNGCSRYVRISVHDGPEYAGPLEREKGQGIIGSA